MLRDHRFLGLPAQKPRVWVDLSCAASKRAGLGMHAPGRRFLRLLVAMLRYFAYLPIEKLILGKSSNGCAIDATGILDDIYGEKLRYATIYMGNDSVKSKITALVVVDDESSALGQRRIVKLAKTEAAAAAIEQEKWALKKLAYTSLCDRVPILGMSGVNEEWTWCEQSVLPAGRKVMKFDVCYRDFLVQLQNALRDGEKVMVHGDFAPWNCSVVANRLYVYDWEDAHFGTSDEDEKWFKRQVKKMLGIDA